MLDLLVVLGGAPERGLALAREAAPTDFVHQAVALAARLFELLLDLGRAAELAALFLPALRQGLRLIVEIGDLLYAGLTQGKRKLQLVRWKVGGRDEWFDAAGVGESRGVMQRPVVGRLTSSFGMRRHPLLGYSRLHQGIDIGAPTGTPIVAASDGVVTYAGWHGGHGNFVKLQHGGGLGTGYGHMSRIAVRNGERVRQGEIIGYVGSTGLSTGPHLHYEVYRNGVPVNPASVTFITQAQLAGAELRKFKSALAGYLSVRVGAPPAFAGKSGGAKVAKADGKDKRG